MLSVDQLLQPLAQARTDEIVVTSMATVRAWSRYSEHSLDFASADSAMGHTADFALGLAMAQSRRKVICLNGDGSMLMTLGTLVTIIHTGVRNFILFVVQNGTYEITGNQPVPGTGIVDFAAMARAAGFPLAYSLEDPGEYQVAVPEILNSPGPVFVNVKVKPGTEGPLARNAAEEAHYLKYSLAEAGRRLREALA